ncbi:unnamed protein product [Rhizophagus irregularis]|uniref:Uncharacterized protein n=1 Tax=Rhizophagus irregularis (strain DAOM 197198w) TaxID=1432141 RepID=A0A015M0K2_RHIIW|nr:hypothetical protein RirG_014180 [Rhizophagus irregularis DAOM 197198w]CAB4478657.1 unnamed protein product [Rhizophagus irregularis]
MKELIDFLQQKEDDLELEKEDLEIVRKKRINGCGFLRITEKKLEKWVCLVVQRLDLPTFPRNIRRESCARSPCTRPRKT